MSAFTPAEQWAAERAQVARKTPHAALPGVEPAEEEDGLFWTRALLIGALLSAAACWAAVLIGFRPFLAALVWMGGGL